MAGTPRGRGHRRPRRRAARGASVVGRRFEAVVGPVAHGGHCVARVELPERPGESRVVFVRHALPGERVLVEVTEGTEGDRFWRGDAVEVRSASPDRVEAPCPYAGPGLCGGCDFQHAALPAQRRLKAAVVREQLVRLGGLPAEDPLVADLVVEPVPGDEEGLRWRTRTTFAPAPDGRAGLRRHRSRDVVPVDDCLITAPGAVVHGPVPPGLPAPRALDGEDEIVETVSAHGATHAFRLAADGFWQVHPGAAGTLVEAVLDALEPAPGERVLDLYAGVGLFAAFLADRGARVVAVEGNRSACAHAERNLPPSAHVVPGSVDEVLAGGLADRVDLVVLDPPREGARRTVVEQVAARAPRAVAYVACDPTALARDLAIFREHGYRLTSLRAFDLFPMTQHVECVALLQKTAV